MRHSFDCFVQRRVDGLILSLSPDGPTRKRSPQLKTWIARSCCSIERWPGFKTAAVLSNHGEGVRAGKPCTSSIWPSRIGFIGGNQHVRPTRARADALLQVAREHRGLRVLWSRTNPSLRTGEAAAGCLLEATDPPTA